MKKIENNVINREKAAKFLDMWRKFWNPDAEELSQEEEISTSDAISDADKKSLMKALKTADGILKPTGGGVKSHLTHNIKVEAKESAQKALKEKPVKVNTKTEKNADEKEKDAKII